jgi:hypothetical protein
MSNQYNQEQTMNQIAQTIQQTYYDRFKELEEEYQLHFASRLYAWNSDATAHELLKELRPSIVPSTHDDRQQLLVKLVADLEHKDFERDVNNYANRKEFFDRYPDLFTLQLVLFRIRHWYCIYGVDERELLFSILPLDRITKRCVFCLRMP